MKTRNRFRTVSTLASLLVLTLAPGAAAAADPAAADVLSLKEASALLRVPPSIVAKLAASGGVPARRVGSQWRFNRVALMEWLQGERHAYPAVPARAATAGTAATQPEVPAEADATPALGSGIVLPNTELALLSARGAAPREPIRLAQAVDAAPPLPAAQPIGEQPPGLTAEEVALREQGAVLLRAGGATIELNLAYGRQVLEDLSPAVRVERSIGSAALTGRYGLRNDLQVTARLPYTQTRTTLQAAPLVDAEAGTSRFESDSYLGDMTASLQGTVLREAAGRPNLIASLDAVLPTGPGDSGLGAGLVLSKGYDPVVLFGGINYLYGLRTDQGDLRRGIARHNVGFNLGYAYAINDSIALSGQFAGIYRTPREGLLPPEKENYLLQLGATWQLGRGLFIDPSVTFGVGSASQDFTFSGSLVYTF